MPKFFEGKKKTICTESSFHVSYLGKTQATVPGVEGIEHSINTIQVTMDGNNLPRVLLRISQEGIVLMDNTKGKNFIDQFFPLSDISFALRNKQCKKIFAFNHHIQRKPPIVECHAVMCDSEEASCEIGHMLYFAFKDKHFLTLRQRRSGDSVTSKTETHINKNTTADEVNDHNASCYTSRRSDTSSLDSSEDVLEYTPQSSIIASPKMSTPSVYNNIDNSIHSVGVDADYLNAIIPYSPQGSTSPLSSHGDQDTRELHMVVNDMMKIVEQEKDQLNSNPTLV